MSIPKIIHYCWFGGNPKPKLAEKCIKSWKRFCPDYEIMEWNEHNFDISAAPQYVRQAYEAKRWAFVTDNVRLKAMTELGGIYMDTDVELVKPLTPYLSQEAFAGFETDESVQTGLLACRPGFPLFVEFLRHYDDANFVKADGTHDVTTNVSVLTKLCLEHGLAPNGNYQVVDGFAIYPKEVFCPVDFDTEKLHRTKKTVAIHWFASSWKTEQERAELEAERKRLRHDKASEARYGFFTKILGEKNYQKLKALFLRR